MKKLFRFNMLLSAVIASMALYSFIAVNDQESVITYKADSEYCNAFFRIESINGEVISNQWAVCAPGSCFNAKNGCCDLTTSVHKTDFSGYPIDHHPYPDAWWSN